MISSSGEENETLDAGRAVAGIVASPGEHHRGEVPLSEAEWTSPSPGNGPEGTSGPEGQGPPLTLKGDPDEYRILFDLGSNLSPVWLHGLHLWKQALSTHYEENIGKTDSFVYLLSLDPWRIVFDDRGLYVLYVGGVLLWHAGLRFFLDVRALQRWSLL